MSLITRVIAASIEPAGQEEPEKSVECSPFSTDRVLHVWMVRGVNHFLEKSMAHSIGQNCVLFSECYSAYLRPMFVLSDLIKTFKLATL